MRVEFKLADPGSTTRIFERDLQIVSQFKWPDLLHRRWRAFTARFLARFSHFIERTRLDLSDVFTRHIEFRREVFERQWASVKGRASKMRRSRSSSTLMAALNALPSAV